MVRLKIIYSARGTENPSFLYTVGIIYEIIKLVFYTCGIIYKQDNGKNN